MSSAFTSQVAGFLSVAGVSMLTKNTIAWASKLNDVADAQRVNVEWLQKMANGAEIYGGKLEDVEKVLDTINKARANPTKESAAAMGRLGLGGMDSLGPAAFFDKISERMASGFDSQSAADLELVGGRSARNLLLAFSEKFANDTPFLTEEMIAQLDDIGDKFTILGTSLKVGLAPAIIDTVNVVYMAVNKLKQAAALFGGAYGGEPVSKAELITRASPVVMLGILLKRLYSKPAIDAAADEILAQNETSSKMETAKGKLAELRRKRREGGMPPPDTSGLASLKEASPRSIATDLNALQKVGAYTSQTPERREMSRMVKTIEKSTEKIARNTEPASFDSGWTRY
jgi:hypothetical protein